MKKQMIVLLALACPLMWSAKTHTPKMEIALVIHAKGFTSNIGQCMLRLYRKEDDVPKSAFKILKAQIINKEASFSISNLTYGEYAAIVVHDQNSNSEIDHSFGFPSEPLGFSNQWKLSLFSGMPSFEKLRFTYSKTGSVLEIEM